MANPISVSIPHQLGRVDARRRISALGQAASGVIEVFETSVAMQVELPPVFAMLANGLKGRLQKAGQLLLTKK